MASDGEISEDEPTHPFVGYDANPTICRTCGAVWPMPCYRVKPAPEAES